MKSKIIIDTGPIVAFLDQNDRYHSWAKMHFSNIAPPLLTCEAVITEACFLLKKTNRGHESLFALLDRIIETKFNLANENKHICKIMERYADLPTSFADACLMRMAEQIEHSQVFTLDTDFRIYRKNNRHVIPLLIPD